MKKARKMLTAVIALAIMVSVGGLEGVTAEAAYCPHQFMESHVTYVTAPYNSSHLAPVYDPATNSTYFVTCQFYSQEYTYALVCTQCWSTVVTYKRVIETHRNELCEEYGTGVYS